MVDSVFPPACPYNTLRRCGLPLKEAWDKLLFSLPGGAGPPVCRDGLPATTQPWEAVASCMKWAAASTTVGSAGAAQPASEVTARDALPGFKRLLEALKGVAAHSPQGSQNVFCLPRGTDNGPEGVTGLLFSAPGEGRSPPPGPAWDPPRGE